MYRPRAASKLLPSEKRAASAAGQSLGGKAMARKARVYMTKLLGTTKPELVKRFKLLSKNLFDRYTLSNTSL